MLRYSSTISFLTFGADLARTVMIKKSAGANKKILHPAEKFLRPQLSSVSRSMTYVSTIGPNRVNSGTSFFSGTLFQRNWRPCDWMKSQKGNVTGQPDHQITGNAQYFSSKPSRQRSRVFKKWLSTSQPDRLQMHRDTRPTQHGPSQHLKKMRRTLTKVAYWNHFQIYVTLNPVA